MDMVIVTKSKRLVELTKRLWNRYYDQKEKWIELSPGAFYTQPYIELSDDEWEEAKNEMPFVSRRLFLGYLESGNRAITHIDNHDIDPPSIANCNILLEADGENHFTSYYDYVEGDWNVAEQGWVCSDTTQLKETFRYTLPLETPTWFRVDKLHDVTNVGNSDRKSVSWVIRAGVTEQDFKQWCEDNDIEYNIRYSI